MAFERAARTSDIPVGTIRVIVAGGKTLAISNVAGTFHAINNSCLHRGGPLGEGPLEGNFVTCPWHGWQFDVTTGKANHTAAGVDCYPVEIRGDVVFVDVGHLSQH